ncbi:MAG TPA: hypothetical protein VN179_06685 [Solirubrobacterales bacterium]|nr:hypothetical protein [Solirubrobacterales bacterium]
MTMARRGIPILVLVLLAAMPTAACGALPPGYVGISPQNQGTVKDYALMEKAGIKSVRMPLYWAGIESERPAISPRRWEGFDQEVRLAAKAGMEIFPFVTASPEWIASDWTELPVASHWQRRAWASFLRIAVRRYGPGGSFWRGEEELPYIPIKRWEIWNEENIVTWASDPEPRRFAQLIRIAGRVIHREAPGSKVILGGLFGQPLQIPPNVASGDFLSRFYQAGRVKQYFDGVALHPYAAGARTMAAQLADLRRIMREHGDPTTPLYVTEVGWGSAPGPSRWERGLYGQARQLDKALSILAANRLRWNVRGVWVFTWTDEGGGCIFCGSAGLLTAGREAKPAWYRFVEWTGGDPDAVRRMGERKPGGAEAVASE